MNVRNHRNAVDPRTASEEIYKGIVCSSSMRMLETEV